MGKYFVLGFTNDTFTCVAYSLNVKCTIHKVYREFMECFN